MKLVHKHSSAPAAIGDRLTLSTKEVVTLEFFRKPTSPASEGKVVVRYYNGATQELYVSVVGLEWIEREDRAAFASGITKAIALTLRYGQILHHVSQTNRDGTPMRVRVNGKVKVWATRPDHFRIPVKYGLKTCGYVEKSVDRDNSEEWVVA